MYNFKSTTLHKIILNNCSAGKLLKPLPRHHERKFLSIGRCRRAVTTHYSIKPRDKDERWTGKLNVFISCIHAASYHFHTTY